MARDQFLDTDSLLDSTYCPQTCPMVHGLEKCSIYINNALFG